MTPKLETIAKRNPAAIIVEASPRVLEMWDNLANDGVWLTYVLDEGNSLYYHFINMDVPQFNLFRTNIWITKRPFIEAVLAAQRYRLFKENGAVEESEYRTFNVEDVSIRMARSYDDEMITTWNVVARLEGSDPDLKHECVIVGRISSSSSNKGFPLSGSKRASTRTTTGPLTIPKSSITARHATCRGWFCRFYRSSGARGSRYVRQNEVEKAAAMTQFIKEGIFHG